MFTQEELKEKVEKDYKGFKLGSMRLSGGEYVSEFTISRFIDDELLLYVYFWDNRIDSYISYFI